MATLIRARTAPALTTAEARHLGLDANIPTPFPSQAEREQDELLQELESEELHIDGASPLPVRLTSYTGRADVNGTGDVVTAVQSDGTGDEAATIVLESLSGTVGMVDHQSVDLMPSILDVQKSCLTMLNDLLSTSVQWKPIIPVRRHSMPSQPSSSATLLTDPSSALLTLVHNLRDQNSATESVSAGSSSTLTTDDAALVRELQGRVERLIESTPLLAEDAALIRALSSLVGYFNRLAALHPSPKTPMPTRVASWSSASPTSPSDPFAALGRQLSDLQLAKVEAASGYDARSPPHIRVEAALLWARVDDELERVLALCHTRTSHNVIPSSDAESLPPEYDVAWYDKETDGEGLPQYDAGSTGYGEDTKAGFHGNEDTVESAHPGDRNMTGNGLSEKMRMDLEAVTLAIDRLYLVAPQLHDQRVELKRSKVEQMEKARLAGPSSQRRFRNGKQRVVDDAQELERMVELIGQASNRKLTNQAVMLEGGLKTRLEQARQRDIAKHEAFVEHLVEHSEAGRLHSQDASRTLPGSARSKEKDPDAMLTLPDFLREPVPEPLQLRMQMEDQRALLSLPEFVKEPMPKGLVPPSSRRARSLKGVRSRSMSAPTLAWLLSSRSSPPSSPAPTYPSESKKVRLSRLRRTESTVVSIPVLQTTLEINYVAEYHESLQHVLVFLTVSGLTPGVNLEAEVVPASEVPGMNNDAGERLLLRCGVSTSAFLYLPARVAPGKRDVKVDGHHYQIKLPASPTTDTAPQSTLLDATYLMQSLPTSYICASCSLPLVQCSRLVDYRDLPSEHWKELVDAWMCHPDQKLHDHVTRHTNEGFWPSEGHAFVGGSYILFEQSAIVTPNLWPEDRDADRKHADDWQRVRCICGAIIGRHQEHNFKDASSVMVYRLAKYAIRPVSPTTEPCRIPLSAFIAEDMNEYVHAHATYRFILMDEEEERPRILIWLFKPSMRIAYTTPTQYVMPKSGSLHVAKVLFKVLGPTTAYSDFQSISSKYPGFPQAEHLYYPLDVCRRLAGLLKESNSAYPDSMRTMTGLDVGWLQRT